MNNGTINYQLITDTTLSEFYKWMSVLSQVVGFVQVGLQNVGILQVRTFRCRKFTNICRFCTNERPNNWYTFGKKKRRISELANVKIRELENEQQYHQL